MAVHDWTRVRANRFHDFHLSWTNRIRDALNSGVLPGEYFALAEQKTGGPEPDVVALSTQPPRAGGDSEGGIAVAVAPPKVSIRTESDAWTYARKANRLAVRHADGHLVAVIEIVSPGNKDSRHAVRAFVTKAVEFLRAGVHLLIIDLFPPTPRDPLGIHPLIWGRIKDEEFTPPSDKPLTLAAYAAGPTIRGYVEPVAVGDALPDMPIFLTPDRYVPCPLEATYLESWAVYPKVLKPPLEAVTPLKTI